MRINTMHALYFSAIVLLGSLGIGNPATICGQDALSNAPQQITNSIGMKLVRIPAGRFNRGSVTSELGSKDDERLHKVELSRDFYMAVTEVTEHQWASLMEPGFEMKRVEERDPKTKRLIREIEQKIPNPRLGSQVPKVLVTWEQAVEFCQQLNELPEEKKEGRRYRLPTEAEWEYACRAGSTSAFCFGEDVNQIGEYAWYGRNSRTNKPNPVAQKRANAWGLYDMHGNVFEWCSDWYGPYPDGVVVDPEGPEQGMRKVNRGSSHQTRRPTDLRSAARYHAPPGRSYVFVGFRPVLIVEQP